MNDYLDNAGQCLSWALTTRSEEHREAFLDVARAWIGAAHQLEKRDARVLTLVSSASVQ